MCKSLWLERPEKREPKHSGTPRHASRHSRPLNSGLVVPGSHPTLTQTHTHTHWDRRAEAGTQDGHIAARSTSTLCSHHIFTLTGEPCGERELGHVNAFAAGSWRRSSSCEGFIAGSLPCLACLDVSACVHDRSRPQPSSRGRECADQAIQALKGGSNLASRQAGKQGL
jgi:hypothetical protein